MRGLVFLLMAVCLALPARAEFIISNAILDFTPGGPQQQDVELISRSTDDDYIVTEVAEIIRPGQADETRQVIEDPAGSGLLVTPDKTILAAGNRKVLRFVLLQPPAAQEHIYRVAVKPVIRGVAGTAQVGLKVLVGYEVLVIVRPTAPAAKISGVRKGMKLTVTNQGNTNLLLQQGTQCAGETDCAAAPLARVYPNTTVTLDLPRDLPVTYTLWDGSAVSEQRFP